MKKLRFLGDVTDYFHSTTSGPLTARRAASLHLRPGINMKSPTTCTLAKSSGPRNQPRDFGHHTDKTGLFILIRTHVSLASTNATVEEYLTELVGRSLDRQKPQSEKSEQTNGDKRHHGRCYIMGDQRDNLYLEIK